MRRLMLGLALATALAVPAASSAQLAPPRPDVICGTACDGGGSGWTGCTTVTGNDQGGVPGDRVLAPLSGRRLLQGERPDHEPLDHRPRLRYERVRLLPRRPGLGELGRRRRRLGLSRGPRRLRHDDQQADRAQLHERGERLDLDGVMPPRWFVRRRAGLGARHGRADARRHALPPRRDDTVTILGGRGASPHDRRGSAGPARPLPRLDRRRLSSAPLRAAGATVRRVREPAAAHHRQRRPLARRHRRRLADRVRVGLVARRRLVPRVAVRRTFDAAGRDRVGAPRRGLG